MRVWLLLLLVAGPALGQTTVIEYSTIPKMSLVGALHRDGVLPSGFIPREGGVRVVPFTFSVGDVTVPMRAICGQDTFDRQAVVTLSRAAFIAWIDSRTPRLILVPGLCREGWEACWPGTPADCPED